MSKQFKVDLSTHLATVTALTAKVGTRIYAGRIPQNDTLPALSFITVSGDEEHCHDTPTGHERTRIQFDAIAEKIITLEEIRDALKAGLNGISGTIGASTNIDFCFYDNEQDFFDEELKLNRKTIDFRFMYS